MITETEVETFEEVRGTIFSAAEKTLVVHLIMRPLLLPTENPIPLTLDGFISGLS